MKVYTLNKITTLTDEIKRAKIARGKINEELNHMTGNDRPNEYTITIPSNFGNTTFELHNDVLSFRVLLESTRNHLTKTINFKTKQLIKICNTVEEENI